MSRSAWMRESDLRHKEPLSQGAFFAFHKVVNAPVLNSEGKVGALVGSRRGRSGTLCASPILHPPFRLATISVKTVMLLNLFSS